jgi:hypothetical protein
MQQSRRSRPRAIAPANTYLQQLLPELLEELAIYQQACPFQVGLDRTGPTTFLLSLRGVCQQVQNLFLRERDIPLSKEPLPPIQPARTNEYRIVDITIPLDSNAIRLEYVGFSGPPSEAIDHFLQEAEEGRYTSLVVNRNPFIVLTARKRHSIDVTSYQSAQPAPGGQVPGELERTIMIPLARSIPLCWQLAEALRIVGRAV